jgi:hypothetical protein
MILPHAKVVGIEHLNATPDLIVEVVIREALG